MRSSKHFVAYLTGMDIKIDRSNKAFGFWYGTALAIVTIATIAMYVAGPDSDWGKAVALTCGLGGLWCLSRTTGRNLSTRLTIKNDRKTLLVEIFSVSPVGRIVEPFGTSQIKCMYSAQTRIQRMLGGGDITVEVERARTSEVLAFTVQDVGRPAQVIELLTDLKLGRFRTCTSCGLENPASRRGDLREGCGASLSETRVPAGPSEP